MISCQEFLEFMNQHNLNFFTGIPDSTFKHLLKCVSDNKDITNIKPANECEAIALAAGYHLSTGKLGIVYLQNSGEGKTVNPLTSLCDKEVYSIPLLMLIGWRGQPGIKDEPQHKKMGRVTIPLLDTLEIPYQILPDKLEDAKKTILELVKIAESQKTPVALIIKKNVFADYKQKLTPSTNSKLLRENAIKIIVDNLNEKDIIISTTGKTSRELFEYRIAKKEIPRDFYTVGSMGCSSSIGLSIALSKPNRKLFVFDGDGAAIMQLGSLATIGHYSPKNFYHIIFDNNSYDSTGGQLTTSDSVDFGNIAKAAGYSTVLKALSDSELKNAILKLKSVDGPAILVVKVKQGARKNLGRPTTTPIENKETFMNFIRG